MLIAQQIIGADDRNNFVFIQNVVVFRSIQPLDGIVLRELRMKNCNLIAYPLLASAFTTFLTSVVVEADTLDKGNLIAQSRRQYECSENGVKPSISGAIYQDGYCFIPTSTGKCIAIQDQYTRLYSPQQGGWQKCRDEDVVTIPTTGKKYYRFSGGSKLNQTMFVLN